MVSGRVRVPDRLILRDRVGDLGDGLSSASRRWSGARSPTLSGASTPRKNSVMYCSFTSSPSSARVSVRMTSGRAVGAAEERDRRRPRANAHAVRERAVQDDVLLVVHDVRAHVVGGNRPRNLTGRAPRRAGARTPALRRRRRSRPHMPGAPPPSPRTDARLRVARPLRDRSSCHPRRLAAVHRQHLALDEVRPRRAEEEDRARCLLRCRPASERDDLRCPLAVSPRDSERDLDVADGEALACSPPPTPSAASRRSRRRRRSRSP